MYLSSAHGVLPSLFLSLIPKPHFLCVLEKQVWSTTYSIFVQVRQNAGVLLLDVIENYIPHSVPMIC